MQVNPADRFEALALLAPAEVAPAKPAANGNHYGSFDLASFLAAHLEVVRSDPYQGGTKYVLKACPFDPNHKAPDAAIIVAASNAIGFKCLHNSCAEKKWQDVRKLYEPAAYDPKPSNGSRQHNQQAGELPPILSPPVKFGALRKEFPKLRPMVVDQLLREGETMSIIAPPKRGKSWLAYSLALSVTSGGLWLGQFNCIPGNVLIVDCELHPETISSRVPFVAEKMGVGETDYEDSLEVRCMRGQLRDILQLRPWFSQFKPKQFQLVILDALYRLLPENMRENENEGMTRVFNAIDGIADSMRCAVGVIHHSSKGSQSEKSVTDVGAGAGAMSRAVDTHLILRQHEEEDAIVLEAACRSWPPISALGLRWEFPLWVPDSGIDPQALKGRKTPSEERQNAKDEEGIAKVEKALRPGPLTESKLAKKTRIGKQRLQRLLGILEERGNATSKDIRVRGNDSSEWTWKDVVHEPVLGGEPGGWDVT